MDTANARVKVPALPPLMPLAAAFLCAVSSWEE
jgi:hypothetical protein